MNDEEGIFQPAIRALGEASNMEEATRAAFGQLFDLAIRTIDNLDENEARSLFLFSCVYLHLADVEKRSRTTLKSKIGLSQKDGRTIKITFRSASALVTRSGPSVKLKAGTVERKINESAEDVVAAVKQIMEHLIGFEGVAP
jgi:hypothetical protein